ncbi:MAG: SRPBCC family protein [Dehalococcoidales bacterium]|nr:SRPBCC family protein [Dehalococcoidales bacterium]
MGKSEAPISINTPIEKVFDAVANPEKMAEYSNASVLLEVKGNPGELGSSADWEYNVAGMKFHATTTVSLVKKPKKLIQEMAGAMPGRWIWNLKQKGKATTVDFCIEYNLPGGMFGRMADRLFLGRMNQKNLEKTLGCLKEYCEKGTGA